MDVKSVTLERGWNILLIDLGISPDNVLRRAELPGDLLKRDPARVTVPEYFRLWRAIEAEADDPLLPLKAVQASTHHAFQPIVFAALCSSSLAVATKRIAHYKRLCAPMTLLLQDRPEGLYVSWEWDDPTIVPPRSFVATELVWITGLARAGTRHHVVPAQVTCPFDIEPAAAYAEFFGTTPVRAERHSVTFRQADVTRPFLTASESMWQAFEPELQRRLSKLDAAAPVSARVRSVLLECLPSGEASVDAAAKRLGMSRRTLQRQLRAEGLAFRTVVRETRERLSRHYLTNTTLTYGEIAFLVGFDEPSSFFRAFRDWTGTTPEQMRRAS